MDCLSITNAVSEYAKIRSKGISGGEDAVSQSGQLQRFHYARHGFQGSRRAEAISARGDDYSAHAVGRDVLALMDHLGQGQAALIGNSFSAGSALWAAHDAPDRISAVVMIGPVLRDPKDLPWYIRAVLAVGLGGPWRVGFWLTYWSSLFPTRKPADFKAYRASLGQNLREPGRMEALKSMVYLSKADTEAMLANTGKPMLVVMGTKDADFPDPAGEASWVAERTGAQVQLMEGAGHYPQTEMPEPCAAAIVGSLQGGSA